MSDRLKAHGLIRSFTCSIAAGLLLLAGCSGKTPDSAARLEPAGQSPRYAELPAPQSLLDSLAAREGTYVEEDLVKESTDYETSLPLSRAQISGDSALLFSPATTQDSLADFAFSTYRFTVEDYDRNAQVRLSWAEALTEGLECWVGLAHWEANRWVWQRSTADGSSASFASFAPFFAEDGTLLLVVLVGGSGSPTLESVRLGGFAPVPDLSADPRSGPSPLVTLLSAEDSEVAEGSIVEYEWDIDGDGSFDITTGNVPTYELTFEEDGVYHPAVRVIASSGLTAEASVEVTVQNYWQHSYGTDSYEYLRKVVPLPAGGLLAVGYLDDPQSNINYYAAVLRFDQAGELLWGKGFDVAESIFVEDAALDSSGDLLLVGYTKVDDTQGDDVLLQKWSDDGVLLWSKYYGGTNDEVPAGLVISGDEIYIGGTSINSQFEGNVFALNVDGTGDTQWGRWRDFDDDHAADIVLRPNLMLPNASGLSLIGHTRSGEALERIWRVDYGLDGTAGDGEAISTSLGDLRGEEMIYVRTLATSVVKYYIGGRLVVDDTRNFVLLKMPEEGESDYGVRITGEPFAVLGDLIFDPAGDIVAAGTLHSGGPSASYGYLLKLARSDGLPLTAHKFASGRSSLRDVQLWHAGLLACGTTADVPTVWEEFSASAQLLSVSWVDADGADAGLGWLDRNAAGNVVDIAELLFQDVEHGQEDFYLEYSPLP